MSWVFVQGLLGINIYNLVVFVMFWDRVMLVVVLWKGMMWIWGMIWGDCYCFFLSLLIGIKFLER